MGNRTDQIWAHKGKETQAEEDKVWQYISTSSPQMKMINYTLKWFFFFFFFFFSQVCRLPVVPNNPLYNSFVFNLEYFNHIIYLFIYLFMCLSVCPFFMYLCIYICLLANLGIHTDIRNIHYIKLCCFLCNKYGTSSLNCFRNSHLTQCTSRPQAWLVNYNSIMFIFQ